MEREKERVSAKSGFSPIATEEPGKREFSVTVYPPAESHREQNDHTFQSPSQISDSQMMKYNRATIFKPLSFGFVWYTARIRIPLYPSPIFINCYHFAIVNILPHLGVHSSSVI